MTAPFEPSLGANAKLDSEFEVWRRAPWYPAAQRMFTEWRDTKSPNVCTLAFARYLKACEEAVATMQRESGHKSYVMRVPYMSNGLPAHHYKRRVTLADFGVNQ